MAEYAGKGTEVAAGAALAFGIMALAFSIIIMATTDTTKTLDKRYVMKNKPKMFLHEMLIENGDTTFVFREKK